MVSNSCVPARQTDRFIYYRSHTGIAGGDIRGKRKTVQVPVRWLRLGEYDKQGRQEDKDNGCPQIEVLQGLQVQVHTTEPETSRTS
jgi:hypothetical protein